MPAIIWVCRYCGAKTSAPAGKRPPITGWVYGCKGSKSGLHRWVKG